MDKMHGVLCYIFIRVSKSASKDTQNYPADFHKIRWKGGIMVAENTIRFWW